MLAYRAGCDSGIDFALRGGSGRRSAGAGDPPRRRRTHAL